MNALETFNDAARIATCDCVNQETAKHGLHSERCHKRLAALEAAATKYADERLRAELTDLVMQEQLHTPLGYQSATGTCVPRSEIVDRLARLTAEGK